MSAVLSVVAGLLLLGGGAFALIAALGVLRFPDVLSRMHASSKVGTMSGLLALTGCALHYSEASVVARAAVAFLFILFTAPVAAHLLARVARRDQEH